ncbi:MAG TPA: PEGA domain-containing protein [Gemmataceae bacterium]|nr:PEGA domain-containing protein [Gemmataceae bacterium]
MTRLSTIGALLIVGALSAGCVDQRYLITSDPPGAMVYRNGMPIGPTPVDDQFVYYGKYHFTLVKDGFETLQVDQDVPAPWYEYPPLDFVNEVLNPFHLHDLHAFNYQMRPIEAPNKDEVFRRGEQLRERGQTLVPQQEQLPPAPPLESPRPAAPGNP